MGALAIDPREVEERKDERGAFCAASVGRIHSTFICPIAFDIVKEKYIPRWPRRNRWRR